MTESSSVLRDVQLIRQAESALDKTENFLKKLKNNKLDLTLEDGMYKINSDDMNKVATLITDLDQSGSSLSDAMSLLKELMIYDEITHMYSRRYILNILEKELIRTKRYKNDFSLIALETNLNLDDAHISFESENLLISKIAKGIRTYKRNSDSAGRTGPFTFLLLLPETNEEGAEILAKRICQDLSVEYKLIDTTVNVEMGYAVVDNKEAESHNLVELMYLLDRKLSTIRK